nr:LamG domain-containing protein [Streptomyces sp. JJ38]
MAPAVPHAAAAIPTATETASQPPTEEQKALSEAKKAGKRVEVTGQRTEHTTVFANPDGMTFTLEESAVPVRVEASGGGWQKPDPTLEKRSDGTIAPKAAAVEMSFANGGDGSDLVSISEDGRSLSFDWQGKLPTPELAGPSALYREVLPDVDLQVTATVEGFQHVLVVKTPKAAQLPELKQLDFGLRARGLEVRADKGGSLDAVDAEGKAVFRAPPAQMWDSSGEASAKAQEAKAPGAANAAEPKRKGSGNDPEQDPATDPGPGDKVARMKVKVHSKKLSVIPDSSMLRETDEAAFPLYIDPTVTWGESERTLLRSDGYEDYAWGNGSNNHGEGVGKCGTYNGYYCGPGYRQRLYFEFSPSELAGKHILDATFRVTQPWSFTCTAHTVQLWRTNNISSSSTWPGPKHLDMMGDRSVSAGRESLCSPSQPDAPTEFHDNPSETNENLTPTVRDFASGKFSRFTLMLKAADESNTGAWKRFRNDAVLAVDYVGKPARPTNIGLVTGAGTVCETELTEPAISADPSPTLTATPQTERGGEEEAQLRVYFDVDQRNSDGSWSDSPASNGDLRPSSGYVGDNAKVTMSWPTLAEGPLYRYRAWTRSYYAGGHLDGPSNASGTGWCYFEVDPTAPEAPSLSLRSPYTECDTNECEAHGGPGIPARIMISAFFPPDVDYSAYQYKVSGSDSWNSSEKVCSVSGFTYCRPGAIVTPERSGTQRVYFRQRDSLGRWGEHAVLDFLVAAGEGPVARWHLSEGQGAAQNSTSAGTHDATLQGGAVRNDRGRRGTLTHDSSGTPLDVPVTDRGLDLNGTTAYAATDGPVLETRSAYTVSAWARLESTAEDAAVLSQDGTSYSPFVLAFDDGHGHWLFGVREADAPSQEGDYWGVASDYPARTGVWTHLAATYDAGTGKVSFYVNGVLQGTNTAAGSWSAEGALQIGRYLSGGGHRGYFNGSIDEVAVWQRALTSQEIADEARLLTSDQYAGAELVAAWNPANATGTAVSDTQSGYGHTLTLSGGASLDGESIVLDGVDDAASSPGPLVDSTGSFTVTTAVALDAERLSAKSTGFTGQVLGQRTADGSAWGFWFEMTGKETVLDDNGNESTVPVGVWHFGRLNSDGTFSSVKSDQVAEMNATTRLTGTYDAQAGTISLYLGHNQNGDDKGFTAKLGSADLAIGRGFSDGVWKHHLPARVSDVRIWVGAMAGVEQVRTTVGD